MTSSFLANSKTRCISNFIMHVLRVEYVYIHVKKNRLVGLLLVSLEGWATARECGMLVYYL